MDMDIESYYLHIGEMHGVSMTYIQKSQGRKENQNEKCQ